MDTTEMDLNNTGQIVLSDESAIDVSSAIPFYYQLQTILEEKIQSGEWKVGQKLPSEKDFCEHFNVSRTVVRKTLSNLASENLIHTMKGKGSFVKPKQHGWHLMQSLQGFYSDVVGKGQVVNTEVLELSDIPASGEIAEYLQLKPGEIVTIMKRLRFLDGEPILVVTTYIPKKLSPDLVNVDFRNRSLYAYLREENGLVIAEGTRTIESINATKELAEQLQVEDRAALSLLKSLGWTKDGTPLEYYVAWHRGDRSQFRVRLVSSEY
ncbi:MAG: GntR family transcriptional regulator [Chloroflexi bacterium]|nr:MAG: GntR family transcriptional regulator [Chloroflexota bacterium]